MRWATTRSSIIARLKDPHDHDAWRTFDRLYGEVMVRYGMRRGLPLDDAQDVRQIVLLSLVHRMPRFEFLRDRGRFRSYLGRVVGNAIQRHRRRAHHAREWLAPDLALFERPAEAAADSVWDEEWSSHHLRRAMETLSRSARPRSIAIFERLLAGDSPENAARAAGASVESVYKLQQRYRARLSELVRRQIEEEARSLECLPPVEDA